LRQLELERPLQAEALREIERSLYSKLKAHRLPDSFIERCGEEVVQIGLAEYLRAVEEGVAVDNRDAFVVRAAFCRAIDELRREARHADNAAIESILEGGRLAAPTTEELAIERLAAEELHKAIEALPAEERQALSLHYFEELSDERSAEILYCSERTFRRRLAKALSDLGRRLGVPAPEPGSDLAIEIGLASWVSLRGARVAISNGPLERVVGAIDGARDGAIWLIERLRDLATRPTVSGASERLGEIVGGPAGKIAGGCAGAAVVCVLGGVVGPGVEVNLFGGHGHPHGVRSAAKALAGKKAAPETRPQVAAPPTAPLAAPHGPTVAHRGAESSGAGRLRAERHRVEQQTSGIARAASESTAPSAGATSSTAAPETEVVPAPTTNDSSASREAAQAEQQFGAFK
jgi:RNA polymerase sigma factor (sigma-70 family)